MLSRNFWLFMTAFGLASVAGCSDSFHDVAPANAQRSADALPTVVYDHRGEVVELQAYRGRPVVLVVVRGMMESPGGVFCPYCLAQATSLTANYKAFEDRNAAVLLLVPGSGESAKAFQSAVEGKSGEGNAIPFPVLQDPDRVTIDQLGVRGDLAKPSTFILNSKGEIVYAYVGTSPSDRPSVKAILGQLDQLGS